MVQPRPSCRESTRGGVGLGGLAFALFLRRARGEPSPGADVHGASAVPVQMWHGVSPVPVRMWHGGASDGVNLPPPLFVRSACTVAPGCRFLFSNTRGLEGEQLKDELELQVTVAYNI